VPLRIPTEADRRAATTRAKLRGQRWLEQTMGMPLYAADSRSNSAETRLSPRSPFGQGLKFIEERCARQISVAEIAEAAQLSPRHLSLLFRQILGCTPLEYAADRRLDLAEQLITKTALSMSAIAEKCGFAEQASLTKSMRRRRGITPMRLRKTARLQDKR